MRGELAEVLGCRMWIDDAAARHAREPDVRERCKRLLALTHLLERGERGKEAGAVIRTDRGDVELHQPSRRLGRRHARERLGALVERQERDDREARHASHRLDRVDDLLEVVERLDHEDVGAAPVEHGRLLGEELAANP